MGMGTSINTSAMVKTPHYRSWGSMGYLLGCVGYVYIHIYTYIHAYIHIQTYIIHIDIRTHVHMCLHVCIYIHIAYIIPQNKICNYVKVSS